MEGKKGLIAAKELSKLEKKPLQEKNRSSRSKIEEDKPKVNFAENVTSSKIPLQWKKQIITTAKEVLR